MIRRIFSTLSTFKTLEFRDGLNVLVAQKEAGPARSKLGIGQAKPAWSKSFIS